MSCAQYWRVLACNLVNGRARKVLQPSTLSFETTLNRVGKGTLSVDTRDIAIRDVWPHLASVYVLRIAGGSATPQKPVIEWGGVVEAVSAGSNGRTEVGLESIETYWHRRVLRRDGEWLDPIDFRNTSQTVIAKYLSDTALDGGIPLYAEADVSAWRRDRVYNVWDRKNIGEAIEQLTDVIGGPDYELVHQRTSQGEFFTTALFRDYVGADRGVTIRSDIEASDYTLKIDGNSHATRVDAIGEGEEIDMLIETAEDLSVYPVFEATPAWKDVSLRSTLRQHAQGYLDMNRDPLAEPALVIAGLEPDSEQLRIGDTIRADISYGAATFRGRARVVGIAWRQDLDGPPMRTLTLTPEGRAADTVLNQAPASMYCDAAQRPGAGGYGDSYGGG